MISRGAALLSSLLIATMMVAASWGWLELPADARVAIHFDALGQPNGWSTPLRAFFTIPVIAVLTWGLFAVLPLIDRRGANIARSEKAYGIIWVAVTLVLCVQEGFLIARAMGAELPTSRFAAALIGALLVIVGNVMGKIRWNYSVGIRTPWTLSDERVWDKTHRFGGWAFVAGGALLLVAVFAMPPSTPIFALTLPVVLGVALATVLKSYLLSRERR
jgi:uncharacterized membrane protein